MGLGIVCAAKTHFWKIEGLVCDKGFLFPEVTLHLYNLFFSLDKILFLGQCSSLLLGDAGKTIGISRATGATFNTHLQTFSHSRNIAFLPLLMD